MSNMETWAEKFARRFKENPLVPLGAAATAVTLIIASREMRRGQSQQMNYWLRARVAAQGFTILAICGGSYWVNKQKREAPLAEAEATSSQGIESGVEKLGLDKESVFEERLRDAGKALSKVDDSMTPTPSNTSDTNPSWLGWLGWKTGTRPQSTQLNRAPELKKENLS